jgi:hypothetical protein
MWNVNAPDSGLDERGGEKSLVEKKKRASDVYERISTRRQTIRAGFGYLREDPERGDKKEGREGGGEKDGERRMGREGGGEKEGREGGERRRGREGGGENGRSGKEVRKSRERGIGEGEKGGIGNAEMGGGCGLACKDGMVVVLHQRV